MKQLNEKVAIVTGAGQGIGKGIALVLARRGVKVVCTGRRLEPIEQTVTEIKAEGGEGFAMTCDSADRARVGEVVAKAVELYVLSTLSSTTAKPSCLPPKWKIQRMKICWPHGRAEPSVL